MKGNSKNLFVRVERICARMNGGLAIVAVALALVVVATVAVRNPELLPHKADGRSPYSLAGSSWTSAKAGF
jgi:hypothetical protein